MRIFLHTILLASVIYLTGCIEINTKVIVNPDGSGSIEETVLMSSQIVNMISQFTGSFSEDTTGTKEEFSIFNEEELKEKTVDFGPSVKYVSGEELKLEGREGYRAVYSFTDINDLTIDQNPGSKISLDSAAFQPESQKEKIVFQFSKGNPSVITIDMPQNKKDDEEDKDITENTGLSDTSSFAQMIQLMEDLKMSMTLEIKGKIVETNAAFVDGSTITLMSIAFADLLKNKEKLEEMKKINPADIEEVKEIMKNVPGIKIELNDPVVIKFN